MRFTGHLHKVADKLLHGKTAMNTKPYANSQSTWAKRLRLLQVIASHMHKMWCAHARTAKHPDSTEQKKCAGDGYMVEHQRSIKEHSGITMPLEACSTRSQAAGVLVASATASRSASDRSNACTSTTGLTQKARMTLRILALIVS